MMIPSMLFLRAMSHSSPFDSLTRLSSSAIRFAPCWNERSELYSGVCNISLSLLEEMAKEFCLWCDPWFGRPRWRARAPASWCRRPHIAETWSGFFRSSELAPPPKIKRKLSNMYQTSRAECLLTTHLKVTYLLYPGAEVVQGVWVDVPAC